jgi:glucose/mannose-6-phosphate isomerase
MMKSVLGLPQQIKDSCRETGSVVIPETYKRCRNILAIGMGGSGIPGDFLISLFGKQCRVPIAVHKDYQLPRDVNEETLVLAVSYSGTTEETLDGYKTAGDKGAKVFGISSGDKLLDQLRKAQLPCYVPPPKLTTRECFGYLLFSMIQVLQKLGFIPDQKEEIEATLSLLQQAATLWGPNNPENQNEAKKIARLLFDRQHIVLYGSNGITDAVALRWKQQIYENSKIRTVQYETLPDATHNQLAAIANPDDTQEQKLCAVFLRNKAEAPQLAKRIDALRTVLQSRKIDVVENWPLDARLMPSIITQNNLGDFVSMYLAVLNGQDPTPTKAMSLLKQKLNLTDLSPK